MAARRWVLQGTIGVLTILTLLTGWLTWRAYEIRSNLNAARTALRSAHADVLSGSDRTAAVLGAAQHHTHSALKASKDPLWSLVSRVPVVGRSFKVAGAVAQVSNRVTAQTLPVLVNAAADLHAIHGAPVDSMPMGVVERLAAPLTTVNEQVDADIASLQDLPSANVVSQVQVARLQLLDELQDLHEAVSTAATTARLGPAMLGTSGTRRYLVAFENPSEARPDDGNIDGYAELVATSGRLHIVRFGSGGQLPPLHSVPRSVDRAFVSTYGALGAGRRWTDTNLSPDFPDDAAAWAAMYAAGTGQRTDGVIALDPVAIEGLATISGGPLHVPGVGVVQPSAIPAFLDSREYALKISPARRQRLVAEVGRITLDRLLSSSVATHTVLQTLGTAIADGHLHLFSTRPAEQAQLQSYPIAGAVSPTTGHYAGVFVRNIAGNKLDYYLREQISYAAPACTATPGPSKMGLITIRLANAVPDKRLPAAVTLRAVHTRRIPPLGPNREALTVVGTAGSTLQSVTVDGVAVRAVRSTVARHPAWTIDVALLPRHSRVMRFRLAEPASTVGRPLIQHQALVRPIGVSATGGC